MSRTPPAARARPSTASPATIKNKKADARRRLVQSQILTTAADLFRARGYRATTLDDLAGRLGMSKATLYGYFPSKEDLLAAIFHRTMTLVEEGLRDIERRGAPPAEQLRQVIRHQVRTVVAEQSFLTVFFGEEPNLPARLARSIARRKAGYDRAVRAIVERGVRSRAFIVPEPRLLVWALLGMSNWVYRWYKRAGAWDADAIADAFIALLEPGYLARPTPRVDLSTRVTRLEHSLATLARRPPKRPGRRKRPGRPGPPRRTATG